MNPFKVPIIGYLGAFPSGEIPLMPALFRWGRALLATDGKNVWGPYTTEQDARYDLLLVLLKRRRMMIDATVLVSCTLGILVMCWALIRHP